MANEEQPSILKQGVEVWNKWRQENRNARIDLSEADLKGATLIRANFSEANFSKANLAGSDLGKADLAGADLGGANLSGAYLSRTDLGDAVLRRARLSNANLGLAFLRNADLRGANLNGANLWSADLREANLREASLTRCIFSEAQVDATNFGNLDLSEALGLEKIYHYGPSSIATDTFFRSKGKIPDIFLRGCGLSDWEVEEVKLYDPGLSNDEVNKILYKMYDFRASQALQISPLFISYSHVDSQFVEKVGNSLTKKGIRYWRDIHEMKAGRLEKQIDRAIRQNPTVLLILSEHSLGSDWVEHEVRTARGLEKEMGRDVLCPVALDDSWKNSPWPKRVMEQIMEYNILDFSAWKDDSKFEGMFRKLIDGLELFYKG